MNALISSDSEQLLEANDLNRIALQYDEEGLREEALSYYLAASDLYIACMARANSSLRTQISEHLKTNVLPRAELLRNQSNAQTQTSQSDSTHRLVRHSSIPAMGFSSSLERPAHSMLQHQNSAPVLSLSHPSPPASPMHQQPQAQPASPVWYQQTVYSQQYPNSYQQPAFQAYPVHNQLSYPALIPPAPIYPSASPYVNYHQSYVQPAFTPGVPINSHSLPPYPSYPSQPVGQPAAPYSPPPAQPSPSTPTSYSIGNSLPANPQPYTPPPLPARPPVESVHPSAPLQEPAFAPNSSTTLAAYLPVPAAVPNRSLPNREPLRGYLMKEGEGVLSKSPRRRLFTENMTERRLYYFEPDSIKELGYIDLDAVYATEVGPRAHEFRLLTHKRTWVLFAATDEERDSYWLATLVPELRSQLDDNLEKLIPMALSTQRTAFLGPYRVMFPWKHICRWLRTPNWSASWSQPLRTRSSDGKSGALFYSSHDKRYLVKSMTLEEWACWSQIADSYSQHMSQNPRSLLVRIVSTFQMQSQAASYRFLVMENVLTAPCQWVFDLKGSKTGRSVTQRELDQAGDSGKAVFKDLDMMHGARSLTRRREKGLKLSKRKQDWLHRILELDSEFLCRHEIMDYSLLVGVQEGVWLSQDGVNSIAATAENDTLLPEVYHMAIIDILQPYGLRKVAEHHFKSILQTPEDLSCVEPVFYRNRFIDYMTECMAGFPKI